jgi:hypothetical protein
VGVTTVFPEVAMKQFMKITMFRENEKCMENTESNQ